jgi:hypothetical protein
MHGGSIWKELLPIKGASGRPRYSGGSYATPAGHDSYGRRYAALEWPRCGLENQRTSCQHQVHPPDDARRPKSCCRGSRTRTNRVWAETLDRTGAAKKAIDHVLQGKPYLTPNLESRRLGCNEG